MEKFTIEYYETECGKIPVEEFILSLNLKMQAKVFRILELLEIKGNELREPYSKHLEDGIFEIRVKIGTNITRIFYFFVLGHKVILTNGFTKKMQKTPRREVELAKMRRDEYMKRNEGKNE